MIHTAVIRGSRQRRRLRKTKHARLITPGIRVGRVVGMSGSGVSSVALHGENMNFQEKIFDACIFLYRCCPVGSSIFFKEILPFIECFIIKLFSGYFNFILSSNDISTLCQNVKLYQQYPSMLLVRSIATHNITAKMCYLTMYPRKLEFFPYLIN